MIHFKNFGYDVALLAKDLSGKVNDERRAYRTGAVALRVLGLLIAGVAIGCAVTACVTIASSVALPIIFTVAAIFCAVIAHEAISVGLDMGRTLFLDREADSDNELGKEESHEEIRTGVPLSLSNTWIIKHIYLKMR